MDSELLGNAILYSNRRDWRHLAEALLLYVRAKGIASWIGTARRYSTFAPPDSRAADIPVVMMTSSRQEQDLVRSYELGVNASRTSLTPAPSSIVPMRRSAKLPARRSTAASFFFGTVKRRPKSSPP